MNCSLLSGPFLFISFLAVALALDYLVCLDVGLEEVSSYFAAILESFI